MWKRVHLLLQLQARQQQYISGETCHPASVLSIALYHIKLLLRLFQISKTDSYADRCHVDKRGFYFHSSGYRHLSPKFNPDYISLTHAYVAESSVQSSLIQLPATIKYVDHLLNFALRRSPNWSFTTRNRNTSDRCHVEGATNWHVFHLYWRKTRQTPEFQSLKNMRFE